VASVMCSRRRAAASSLAMPARSNTAIAIRTVLAPWR
jgi:hypothetical protein